MSDKTYKVKNEAGEWVQVAKPVPGQRFRAYDPAGGFSESLWADPVVEVAPVRITKLAFKLRLTSQERKAVRNAKSTGKNASPNSEDVDDFMDLMDTATYVDLSSPLVLAGLQLMQGEGLLTESRVTEILSAPVTAEEKWSR